jgi:8-oxo-dGTP diphosphatase
MTINKSLLISKPIKMLVAVDLVILTIIHNTLSAVLIKRAIEPYQGRLALPGGFIKENESLEDAATRELEEETGLSLSQIGHIEQLGTFGEPKRDPRGRVISIAYLAFVPNLPIPKAGGDASEAHLIPLHTILTSKNKLAFDHTDVLRVGVERTRAKLEYTPLATTFCGAEFTINQLRHVYECVWDTKLDPANFHRKVTKTEGFLIPTRNVTSGESGRPAQLYITGNAVLLYPPLMRPVSS